MSLWNSLLGPFMLPDWTPTSVPQIVPAAIEAPIAPESSAPVASRGRDAEPEHLRRLRERVESLETQRDFALSRYIEAQARYRDQQPTWSAES